MAAWIEDTSHDFSTSASASIYKPLIVTAPNAIECKKIQDTINTPGSSGIIQRKLLEYSQQDGEEGDEGSGGEVEGTAGPSGAVISARSVNHITEPRLRKRKCRLILRNLSFQATESNISSKLMTFGPLTEVSIARVPVSGDSRRHRKGGDDQPQEPKLKSRGFAFVTFLCESDAKRAVEGSSALRICNREFALDFCTAKDKQATAAEEEAAVHSSVDKDTNMDAADTESESDIGEEESGSDAGGHEMSGSEDASPEDMDGEDSDGESAAEEPIPIEPDKPAKPADVGEGKTVFVR